MIPDRFHHRIISVDYSIAVKFGEIQGASDRLLNFDALIATTAITKHLTLVTHNSKDMARSGATMLKSVV